MLALMEGLSTSLGIALDDYLPIIFRMETEHLFLKGWVYLVYSLVGDLCGVIGLIGVGMTVHAGEQLGDVVFVELPNTKIELLEPLGEASPIKAFLEKNPSGGIHHVCYEVADIIAARDHLKASGARVLGDGTPKIGAHGKPVLFLHPKDFCGTLVELEQA